MKMQEPCRNSTMRRTLYLITAILLFERAACAMSLDEFVKLTEDDAQAKIIQLYHDIYPDNPDTAQRLVDSNMENFRKLKNMQKTMSDGEKEILERRLHAYNYNFAAVLLLYKKDLEGDQGVSQQR